MDSTTKQRKITAEQRLKELGIELADPPEPFGSYVEAVQTGNLLFLSGMSHFLTHIVRATARRLELTRRRGKACRTTPWPS